MEPTLEDTVTGTIRQIKRNATDLIGYAGALAATAGVNVNDAHNVLDRAFSETQRQQSQTWQQQRQMDYTSPASSR